jgi:hypothetical protein
MRAFARGTSTAQRSHIARGEARMADLRRAAD